MIKLILTWDEKFPRVDTSTASLGSGTLSINNQIIWDKVATSWVDFLEHLTASWEALLMEGTLKSTASEIDRFEYELNHDLSKGVKGKIVPSILVYRYGNDFEIRFGETKIKALYNEIIKDFNFIGNLIVARLNGLKDARSKKVINMWHSKKW